MNSIAIDLVAQLLSIVLICLSVVLPVLLAILSGRAYLNAVEKFDHAKRSANPNDESNALPDD